MNMNMGGLNLHNAELKKSAGISAQLVKSGLPQVALAGRSNVGKSSLVNSLLGRKKLARVSSEPGKTITVNYYEVDGKMYLVDLPGYGYARRSKEDTKKWSALTQNYFEENDALKLVLQLVDAKIGLTEDDRTMLAYMNYYNIPYLVVATKCDRLGRTQLAENARRIAQDARLRPGTEVILYSSEKNIGRDELWGILLKHKNG